LETEKAALKRILGEQEMKMIWIEREKEMKRLGRNYR
jgi:hypothetical protein